jgi:hypothetical protein
MHNRVMFISDIKSLLCDDLSLQECNTMDPHAFKAENQNWNPILDSIALTKIDFVHVMIKHSTPILIHYSYYKKLSNNQVLVPKPM